MCVRMYLYLTAASSNSELLQHEHHKHNTRAHAASLGPADSDSASASDSDNPSPEGKDKDASSSSSRPLAHTHVPRWQARPVERVMSLVRDGDGEEEDGESDEDMIAAALARDPFTLHRLLRLGLISSSLAPPSLPTIKKQFRSLSVLLHPGNIMMM